MPKVDAAVDLAEEAFYDRCVTDTDLTSELGHTDTDERIIHGRDEEVLDTEGEPAAALFPRLLYFGVTGPELGGGYGQVTIQCDLLVWPEGENGGIGMLKEIDAALLGLIHKQAWHHNGRRFMAPRTTWRRGTSGTRILRRIREFRIAVGG